MEAEPVETMTSLPSASLPRAVRDVTAEVKRASWKPGSSVVQIAPFSTRRGPPLTMAVISSMGKPLVSESVSPGVRVTDVPTAGSRYHAVEVKSLPNTMT